MDGNSCNSNSLVGCLASTLWFRSFLFHNTHVLVQSLQTDSLNPPYAETLCQDILQTLPRTLYVCRIWLSACYSQDKGMSSHSRQSVCRQSQHSDKFFSLMAHQTVKMSSHNACSTVRPQKKKTLLRKVPDVRRHLKFLNMRHWWDDYCLCVNSRIE